MKNFKLYLIEISSHALMIFVFFLIMTIISFLGGKIFWDAGDGNPFYFALSVDLVLLMLVPPLVALVGLWLRGMARWLVLRLGMALVYLFLVLQFQFQGKTGYFFSGDMLLYVLSDFFEVFKVISSGVDHWMVVYVLVALFFFSVPVLETRGGLSRSQGLYVVSAVAFLLMVLSMPYSWAREWRGESLVYTLLPDAGEMVADAPEYPYVALDRLRLPSAGEALPDILLIVLESARAQSIQGFSGSSSKASMPNLQALAGKSRLFDRAYTTTSHTSKALLGMLCGVHPNPVAGIIEARPGGVPVKCLPALLKQQGYDSLFIQSATKSFESRRGLVDNMGFDQFLAKEQIQEGFSRSGYFGLDEMAMLKPLAEWWASAQSATFTTILTSMSHHPYEPLDEGGGSDEERYLRTLSYADEFIGRLFDLLAKSGRLKRTIVVIVGDHGEAFGEHGLMQHDAVPFDEVVRTPLLVFDGRGMLATGRDEALRQHIDLLPTILGITTRQKIVGGPGIDLFDQKGHDQIMTSCLWPGSCMSLIAQDRKWIYFPSSGKILEFLTKSDPDEKSNLLRNVEMDQEGIANTLRMHQQSLRDFYAPRLELEVAKLRFESK